MPSYSVPIDGITYHALLEGPPNTPIILLTHALMSNLHMWDSTILALHSANYQTLRFDHIGHNLTPAPTSADATTRTYTLDDITHHMHAIAKHFSPHGLKAVIGCSIGGVLALRYGMLYPGEVEVVVSLCAPGINSPEETKPLWTSRIQQFEADSDSLCHATVARWLPGSSPHDEAVRNEALGHVRTCSLEGYRVLADAIRGYDYGDQGELEELAGVGRCVIVAGRRDTASNAEVLRELAGRIPDAKNSAGSARFVLMEEAGHIPPMHCAREFEEMMLGVLGSGEQ